jgi:hypothetical protein
MIDESKEFVFLFVCFHSFPIRIHAAEVKVQKEKVAAGASFEGDEMSGVNCLGKV